VYESKRSIRKTEMNIRPLNNYVLLKIKQDPSKLQFKNGQSLFVDTSFAKEKHSAVICEVVKTPEKLIFGFSNEKNKFGNYIQKPNSMDWETEIEVRPGDEVIIHYMGYVTAFNDEPKHFEIDGQEYFFCQYNYIYLTKRRWTENEEKEFWELNHDQTDIPKEFCEKNNIVIDGKAIYNVVMCNGYTLVQPVERQYESSLIIIPDSLKKESNKKKVRVCYNGSNNKRYISDFYVDADVKAGDIVIVDKNTDVPLEYNETFNGKEKYWRIQKCLIQAIQE
jgi:co-chaperonin GroES (HSP10)